LPAVGVKCLEEAYSSLVAGMKITSEDVGTFEVYLTYHS
jgi:hypothetical protein